jgi:hypothetical protein
MRAGTADGRTLALARKTALVLFACSVLLPVVTVFRRDAAGGGASSDAGALLDEAAFRASDGSAHAGVRQAAARKLPSDAPPDAPAGTRVLVFLARESGSVLQLHVRPGGDVCSGASGEGETLQRAALRVLWDCAALGPPPDIEFLERVGVGVAAEPVAYVALVRSERLLLRGSASAQLQVRAPAAAACAVLLRAVTTPRRLTAYLARVCSACGTLRLQSLSFEALQAVADAAAGSASEYAPGVAGALPAVQAFLAPWSATAGKKDGACAPTAAARHRR